MVYFPPAQHWAFTYRRYWQKKQQRNDNESDHRGDHKTANTSSMISNPFLFVKGREAASLYLDYGLLALEAVDCCGKAEHAHEGSGGLLVTGCNRSPLFQPGPEPLDDITDAPDVVAEAVTG
jgi:hypothetical protein